MFLRTLLLKMILHFQSGDTPWPQKPSGMPKDGPKIESTINIPLMEFSIALLALARERPCLLGLHTCFAVFAYFMSLLTGKEIDLSQNFNPNNKVNHIFLMGILTSCNQCRACWPMRRCMNLFWNWNQIAAPTTPSQISYII